MRKVRGFTLVEILIVVIILGILAAIVIPQFTNTTAEAKINSLKQSLATIRSQIEMFKQQHNDVPPAATNLATILTNRTTVGDTTDSNNTSGTFGPYITAMPVNPLNNFTTVAAAAAANVGWVYTVTSTNIGGVTLWSYQISATDTSGTTTLTY
jgi:general secretion pathway protein G